MDQLAKQTQPARRPFRFGIADLTAAVILFGAQLSVFRAVVPEFVAYRDDDRLVALAFIVAAYTFGAAYLCGRFLTEHEKLCGSFFARVGLLLIFDAGLIALTGLIVMCVNYEFVFVAVVVF